MTIRFSLIGAAVALWIGAGPATTPQPPDLAGTWILNHEDSDDPRERLQELRPAGREGMRGGARPGSSPGAGPRGRPGDRGGDVEAMRRFIDLAVEPAERLVITLDDSTVSMTLASGELLILHTDGRNVEESSLIDAPLTHSAEWQNERYLTVKRRMEGGRELTESYSLSPLGDQLFVVVRLSLGRGDPVEFRRVYDPEARGGAG